MTKSLFGNRILFGYSSNNPEYVHLRDLNAKKRLGISASKANTLSVFREKQALGVANTLTISYLIMSIVQCEHAVINGIRLRGVTIFAFDPTIHRQPWVLSMMMIIVMVVVV